MRSLGGPRGGVLRNALLTGAVAFWLLAGALSPPVAGAASSVGTQSPGQKTLTSPSPEGDGYFGFAGAANGGVSVIGAWGETVSGNQFAGHAYVFNETTGALLHTLTSPDPQTGGQFGYSVAVNGDIVVVGAPLETSQGLLGAGNAYVFSAKSGALLRTLVSPNVQSAGEFGSAVAARGNAIVIGAPQEATPSGKNTGSAYVFNAMSGRVAATLASPNAAPGGEFGGSVAVGGEVAVGAPFEAASGAAGAGHAYLFNAAGGSPLCTLSSPHPQADGEFGFALGAAGGSVVVGAPMESYSGLAAGGRAYSFDSNSCALVAPLLSPGEQAGGEFGFAVATNGRAAIVGAPVESAAGIARAGSAYAFNALTGAPIIAFASPHPQYYGNFGTSVAIDRGAVLVGAWGEFAAGDEFAGNAYINPLASHGVANPIVISTPDAASNEQFGWSVGTDGSVVAVGAYFQFAGGTSGGAVYTYDAKTGGPTGTLISSDPQPEGEFGYSVAVGGGVIVVGAPFESSGGMTGAGNAYLFDATDGALLANLSSPAPQYGGNFGTSVAAGGGIVVVGAPLEAAGGQSGAGTAYAFNATTGALVGSFSSPRAQSRGFFGWSVATDGGSVVIGAIGEQVRSAGFVGHVYVFNATSGALQASLTSPHAQPLGDFGASVGISSGRILVGADSEAVSGQAKAGHAYLFNASTYSLVFTFASPDPQYRGLFGAAVALGGTTVVVGAGGESADTFTGAGNAYVFDASTGAMVNGLSSPNAQPFGVFGYSVATAGGTTVVGAPYETLSTGYAYAYQTG